MADETRLTVELCESMAVTENALAFRAEPGSEERAAHDERREAWTLAARAIRAREWCERAIPEHEALMEPHRHPEAVARHRGRVDAYRKIRAILDGKEGA